MTHPEEHEAAGFYTLEAYAQQVLMSHRSIQVHTGQSCVGLNVIFDKNTKQSIHLVSHTRARAHLRLAFDVHYSIYHSVFFDDQES
jgi:hypothetical protein